MTLQPLFTLESSDDCQLPYLKNLSRWSRFDLEVPLNFQPIAPMVPPMEFEFIQDGDKSRLPIPDISMASPRGMLIFPASMIHSIFPNPCPKFEFLPVVVLGKDWCLMNCLKSTKGYEAERSTLIRAENGLIYFVQHLLVTDDSVENCELFTLEDSNRAQLFCVLPFKERIEQLGLKGLRFREIGEYRSKR